MTRSSARDDPHLVASRPVPTVDDLVLVIDTKIRMCRLNPPQRFGDDVLWVVDELLHGVGLLNRIE
jgi:hypothetical protein